MSEKGYTEVDGKLVKLPNAPPMINPPAARDPINLTVTRPDGEQIVLNLRWEDAAELNKHLGQELAKCMRPRGGSAPTFDPDFPGAPVAMAA